MKFLLGRIKGQMWFLPICLMVLNCCKIVNWGKENFRQTSQYSQKFIHSAKTFIRSIKVYDQFSTAATFDVMLLSDSMRQLYVDYFKKSHGLSDDQEEIKRQHQKNENKYFISFYVVATQKERLYTTNKALFSGEYQIASDDILGQKDSEWSVRMIVGGREYYPESIQSVELPIEYRQLFGFAFNQFSTVYLVRFSTKDKKNEPILEFNKKSSIILRFSSSLYQTDISWKNILYNIE